MDGSASRLSVHNIREDFVPKDSFISPEFLRLENERLWPKVWQIACREEEIPEVGNYVTYDIAGESLVVVRTAPDVIKAYYNVCQHRGRILMDQPAGRTKLFHCRYHGWRWSLDGGLMKVTDEQDWAG